MKEFKDISSIYFIGIGGIGMSALARYFKFHGKAVSGYDKTETELTRSLVSEGIPIHYVDDPSLAAANPDLVVYTPAVPADHRELNAFKSSNHSLLKRSDVLGIITNSSFNIAVAGTHGKTTITTMIAHLLRDSGFGCNAFLGGISVNYNSNFWSDPNNVSVIEADEYDRSFLKLRPDIAVITAMDADHLDIYGDEETMRSAFVDFSGKLKEGGLLISRAGIDGAEKFTTTKRLTYGVADEGADVFVSDIQMHQGTYRFAVRGKDTDYALAEQQHWEIADLELNMGGMHNVHNMTAAVTVARQLKIADEKIRKAVSSFRGVKRRFEYHLNTERLVYIDDYAHHPEELRALVNGARQLFPDYYCVIVFQPHLFTRTRDFAVEFAGSLELADRTILLPIYPAREIAIPGVSSEIISKEMASGKVKIIEKSELMEELQNTVLKGIGDRKLLLITAGAGDIDTFVDPVRNLLIA